MGYLLRTTLLLYCEQVYSALTFSHPLLILIVKFSCGGDMAALNFLSSTTNRKTQHSLFSNRRETLDGSCKV